MKTMTVQSFNKNLKDLPFPSVEKIRTSLAIILSITPFLKQKSLQVGISYSYLPAFDIDWVFSLLLHEEFFQLCNG